jgi:glycerophosphoryl diester phosphodiesterase
MCAAPRPDRPLRLPVCIAHRGASGHEPENTLRSFSRALDDGATWLELDVHAAHGRLLVIHDDTLDRTTDGAGPLADLPLERLRTLDAGRGERIPLLEEVLALAAGRARVNIELKGPGTAAPVIAVLRDEVAAGRWQPEKFVLSSFDWEALEEARRLEPAIPVAPLAGEGVGAEVVDAAERMGAEAIHISRWCARRRMVTAAHNRGLQVRVFTVNHDWEYDLMARLDVDAIFTDFPGRALAWGAVAPVPV